MLDRGMLENWRRERWIRKVLAGLARQRVALVLQPGNVWVIELALERDGRTEAALRTCHMRGWIEPLHDSVQTRDVTPDLKLPSDSIPARTETLYRLTDGGWNALNRAHVWTLFGIVIGIVSLAATVIVAG